MRRRFATRAALFGLGYLSIGSQVYLLREYASAFGGNEFITGLLFTQWMLLTGIGALAARYNRRQVRLPSLILLLAATLVFGMVMLAAPVLLKVTLVRSGSIAGLNELAITALILLAPFCFTNGYLFVRLCAFNPVDGVATGYAAESVGSVVAGALTGGLILFGCTTSTGMKMIMAGSLIAFTLFSILVSDRMKIAQVVLTLVMLLTLLVSEIDIPVARDRLFPDQKTIESRETPYGRVDITMSGNQRNFYENGSLLFSENNEMMAEEDAHTAMVQVSNPQHILVISGGFYGILTEVLKYNPVRIDYVELNPALLQIAEKYTQQLSDPRISVFAMDPRRFLHETVNMYDVILVNVPPPSTLQMNRLYTVECMGEMKRVLKPEGVVAYILSTSGEYAGKATANFHSVMVTGLHEHFRNTRIIPFIRNHLLASDGPLHLDVTGRMEAMNIQAVYLNRHYIDQAGVSERSEKLGSQIDPEIIRNHDFKPSAVFFHSARWLTSLGRNPLQVVLIPAVLLIMVMFFMNPVTTGLFTGGFTLASFEMILILTAQIWFGYAFQLTALIILSSMTGLAIGAMVYPRPFRKNCYRYYFINQVFISFFTVGILWLILWAGAYKPSASLMHALLFSAMFFSSFLTGISFRFASELLPGSRGKVAPVTYSADLFGAAAGSFIITLLVFPLAGVRTTGLFIALLNVVGALRLIFRARNSVPL